MDATGTWQGSRAERIRYPLIEHVAASPDGRQVVYVVREPLMSDEQSEYISHLYLAGVDGGEGVQLTYGDHRNGSPRWSPDGRYLAFLSKRSGKANIYVMRAGGGEAWSLTRYDDSDVSDLRWSPSGDRLGFVMVEPPTEENLKSRKAKDDALQFGVDFDFAHLYTVPFAVGPRTPAVATQVTRGRYHVVGFCWLPDGERLALTYRPTPVEDTWVETQLATVSAAGGDPSPIAPVAAFGATPWASPDGRWIACATSDRPPQWGFAMRVVLYPVAGGEPRVLPPTPDSQAWPIGWSEDSTQVYVWESRGTTTQLWALPASGERGRPLTDTALLKTIPSVDEHEHLVFAGQDFDRPNGVYRLDPATGAVSVVTQPPLPRAWPRAPLPRAEVVQWQAPDGQEIEGILIYPLQYQEGQRYPLVVEVHGGPTGVYTRSYLGAMGGYADLAGLAEAGYAILRANPRGSSGYGREFRFANYNDWGGGDYRDIMAGVDRVIERGLVDPERLGILGWSYGGFMTSWVITQTQRFKAACVGAGVTNLMSFTGTADIPSFIPDYMSGEFWENPEAYRTHSAMFNVRGVRTPTLIQHGDQDIRVPLSQGRELYNALQRQGVAVELVIYPRQGHAVDEPRLAIDVKRRVQAWFARWIPTGPTAMG